MDAATECRDLRWCQMRANGCVTDLLDAIDPVSVIVSGVPRAVEMRNPLYLVQVGNELLIDKLDGRRFFADEDVFLAVASKH